MQKNMTQYDNGIIHRVSKKGANLSFALGLSNLN